MTGREACASDVRRRFGRVRCEHAAFTPWTVRAETDILRLQRMRPTPPPQRVMQECLLRPLFSAVAVEPNLFSAAEAQLIGLQEFGPPRPD